MYSRRPPMFASSGEAPLETNASIYDPLCKLNLKETSEFVKSLPMASHGAERRAQKRPEAPCTPGRPVFSFSVGNGARKSFPSKWDDAEKWLISTSCNDSPAHPLETPRQMEIFPDKSMVTQEKVSKLVSTFHGSVPLVQPGSTRAFNGVSGSKDVLLKDRFTDDAETITPNLRYSEPTKQGFVFRNSTFETVKDAGTEVVHEVQCRDVGTEMTPLGSSTTSRCPTPFKSSSPARHNTPTNRSGPLALADSDHYNNNNTISLLQECHLAKLQLGTQFQYDSITSNWSSREQEEEDVSKSLRHSEAGNGIGCPKSVSDSRASACEEEEKTKCCLRYQREEAKIQAWMNLQSAKAEAESKKLEVKIQKMRSKLEEKLMKRMAIVHRKAEEWRAAAQQQHTQHLQRVNEEAHKMVTNSITLSSAHTSCGCFPCNALH